MNSVMVSVVLPTRNRSVFLGDAVRSIISQAYPHWECLIVDDGSTDDTEKVICDIAQSDSRLQYHRQNHGGVSRARNKALEIACGEYVAFLDDDDVYFSDKLATQVQYLNDHPDIGFAYGQIEIVDKGGKLLWMDPKKPVFDYAGLFEQSAIRIQSVMCRRECFDKVGGFDESLTIGEDYDLWLRMARYFKFSFIEKPLVRMCFHGENTCNNFMSLLKRVPVDPAMGIGYFKKQRRLASNYYRLGRLYKDARSYWQSAKCFLLACLNYPAIGVVMAERDESIRNILHPAFFKPYAAVVYLLIQAMLGLRVNKSRKIEG